MTIYWVGMILILYSVEDGNDQIYGGTGDNILKGGTGKDYFNCGPDHNVILDFNSTEDKVDDNCKDAQYAH